MRHLLAFRILVGGLFALAGCSSTPRKVSEQPAWIHHPTRTVDSGYLVYIGSGEDRQLEKAAFKAESAAIADLANECSFAPKGSRIEDRFSETIDGIHYSYAKIGLVFEECESAKKAVTPEDVIRLANVPMSEQLKHYQELYYMAANDADSDDDDDNDGDGDGDEANAEAKTAGEKVIVRNDPHFFVVRQQVVYYKQNVILSPTIYRVEGPARAAYINQVTPATTQVQFYETAHPMLQNQRTGWSSMQNNPAIRYPSGFNRPQPQLFQRGVYRSRPPAVRRQRNPNRPPKARNPYRKRRHRW